MPGKRRIVAAATAWPACACLCLTLLACGSDSPATPVGTDGEIHQGTARTVVAYPGYRAVVRHGSPFGLTSLALTGQPGDFAHPSLPLSDWEWFWYDVDGREAVEKRSKLLQANWGAPAIERHDGAIHIGFSRRDVVLPGIDLDVTFRFRPAARFEVDYTISNAGADSVPLPYSMLGFPGFTNRKRISVVATNEEPRYVDDGFDSFWEEAQADGRSEYVLSQDAADEVQGQPLKAMAAYSILGASYRLQAQYLAPAPVTAVHSAHVNKPAYLTSHLYISMADLAPGQRITHTVEYELHHTAIALGRQGQ